MIGEIISGIFGAHGQREANKVSIDLANTAYQRRVKDLQAAGLNPMLAYTQGGAQTPNIGSVGGAGVASAQQASGASHALALKENVQAQTELLRAQTADLIRKVRGEANSASARGQVDQESILADMMRRIGEGRSGYAKGEVDERSIESDVSSRWSAADIARAKSRIANSTVDAAIDKIRGEAQREKAHGQREMSSTAADIRRREAEALLAELEIPEKKAGAKFWEDTGEASQIVRFMKQILQLIRR